MELEAYFNKMMKEISIETESIDIDTCDISIEESITMVEFLKKNLSDLRDFFLSKESIGLQEEIVFFKEMKPEILGLLLYFNKIHNIELRRPTGSNSTQMEYYENELRSITFFFERHLDFYQYYRSKSTYLDEYYFVRGKACPKLCADSTQYIRDPLFSTVYDFKIAKIISNEMLRIYLNKKLQYLEKYTEIVNGCKPSVKTCNKWTGAKSALTELGYSIHAAGVVNNGNADIRDIMDGLQNLFGIELGDYYRTYIALKNRKKDRTAFLKHLIDSIERRMDEEFDV